MARKPFERKDGKSHLYKSMHDHMREIEGEESKEHEKKETKAEEGREERKKKRKKEEED